jgi:SAM-dependent methyltransferase
MEHEVSPGIAERAPIVPAARQYGDVAGVYDSLMRDVPHHEWLSRIERAARDRLREPHSALDVACGTGIVSLLLAQRGYAPVVGVDLSPAMIGIARTKALAAGTAAERNVTFVAQDAAELDLGTRPPFDLVVSLFDSLNYLLDPERLAEAFRRIFRHTAPGGVFAFDMNSMYALSHDLFSQSHLFGPVQHVWTAHWDRESRICRVEMEFSIRDADGGATRHFTETHVQRAYTVPEVTERLTDAGFVHVECFGNYGMRPPGPKSDRLLFVCERG